MNQSNKTLVATVIHPVAKDFIEDCFKGINNQNDKDFDFLIVEDGITFLYKFDEINVQTICSNGASPIKNRELIINYAIDNHYDNLIFMDSDDIALPNRVGFIKSHLKRCDAILHDMQIINSKNRLIKNEMFGKDIKEISISSFCKKNLSGLGNTGYKVSKLSKSLPLPTDFPAIDWWIIVNILLNRGKVEYMDDILTKYRQYDNNTANVLSFNQDDIFIEYLLKQKLYCYLLIKYPNRTEIVKEIKDLNKKFDYILNMDFEVSFDRKTNIWWNLINELEEEK